MIFITWVQDTESFQLEDKQSINNINIGKTDYGSSISLYKHKPNSYSDINNYRNNIDTTHGPKIKKNDYGSFNYLLYKKE